MVKLVYVIILNYNGGEDTLRCIQSVKSSRYQNFRILVVDNASTDESVQKIRRNNKNLEMILLENNIGFAGGNNVGIRYALEKGAELICILNNDVIISEDMLDILVENFCENERSIVGPATLFWNQKRIHSTGLNINFYKGTADIINLNKEYDSVLKEPVICDYLEGTCLLFPPELIDEVGYIPEEYFLYFEETEWCCKAKRKGWQILCLPDARLWHKGSASVNKIDGLKVYCEDRNRVLFEKRNAPWLKKMIFYHYYGIQLIYRILTRQRNISAVGAALDGLLGRFNTSLYKGK